MKDEIGILSRELWAVRREIAAIGLGTPVRFGAGSPLGWSAVAGPPGRRGVAARRVARFLGVPYRAVSSGPLAAVRPEREPPMSLAVAGWSSASPHPPADGFDLVRRLRLSWRNDGLDRLPDGRAPEVLVVGRSGGALPAEVMALALRDGAPVAMIPEPRSTPRPEPLAGASRRADDRLLDFAGINPWAALEVVRRAYAARDGDLARLAALSGLPVVGPDGSELYPERDGLFASTYADGVTWFDAWSRQPCPFERAVDQLAWLRDRFHDTGPRAFAVGISRWKRDRTARFLDGPAGAPAFFGSVEGAVGAAARAGGQVVTWETRMPARLPAACAAAGVPLTRMEDGFLRSVGLGSAFLPGASAVLDGRGIYYDPSGPSDLEYLLATAPFPPDLLARAASLREAIVTLRVSKYNVGRSDALAAIPDRRDTVLVPGQVEDDASILLGSPAVRGNLALLEAARRRNPDAFLIFKPHPDVSAGLRVGAVDPAAVRGLADLVLPDAPIAELLDRVGAVETMTSLAGFEALLRGKRVTVHGRPFYAGWHLSDDLDPPTERGRRLSLDALVAGALILYPRYLDPTTGLRCPPEILVERLAAGRDVARGSDPWLASLHMAYVRLRHRALGPLARGLNRLRGVSRASGSARDGAAP